jgi:predicted nucleic acid-binding protein
VINQSLAQIRRAVEVIHLYKICFWNACIINNAEHANCTEIYSEDLNTGQFYTGIQIVHLYITGMKSIIKFKFALLDFCLEN